MRIAIIGAGISGLVVAHVLRKAHEVTVLEAAPRLGGHTNTVRFTRGGREYAVDTGFIVFNETNYPRFTRLLGHLGVESQDTTMGFSVRSDVTGLEYSGESLERLFVQPRNLVSPGFLRMVRDIRRFYRQAVRQVEQADDGVSVRDFVRTHRYGREFVRDHLVPLGSSLWSCPPGRFLDFPVRLVVDFFANHRMLQVAGRPVWRTVRGGSDRYVEALVRELRDRIRLATPVRRVERDPDGVTVATDSGSERFDEVVLACHGDQALRILADPTPREAERLGAVRYRPNEAVLHTDAGLLPRRRRAWAAWNYHLRAEDQGDVAVTYCMNILQRIAATDTFCVTLNEADRIAPDAVLHREVYEHPVWEAGRDRGRQTDLIRANRTSFCGAYWGFGFHEDGVASALAVTRAFGAEPAW